jgi:hypothetical protein
VPVEMGSLKGCLAGIKSGTTGKALSNLNLGELLWIPTIFLHRERY